MTLSRWLRDYLYIPLGGNRGGKLATYRNLMLTMLLGGLWHGAAWTFVVWGAIHGTALAVERLVRERGRADPRPDTAAGAGSAGSSPSTSCASRGSSSGPTRAHGLGDADPAVHRWGQPSPLVTVVVGLPSPSASAYSTSPGAWCPG